MLYHSEDGRRAALVRLASAYETDKDPALAALRRRASYVPGRGSVFPRVVIVGEAPGRTEEKQKRPFCGPSGKVLDQLLESIELSRDDIYITNAVKYRPNDSAGYNRTPTASELLASTSYLSRELQIVGATRVLALGKQAMKVFLGNRPHDVVRGSWRVAVLGSYTYHLLPLYHPAVAVYQRSRLPLLIEEFQAVKERI